jgi:hypothetical protein
MREFCAWFLFVLALSHTIVLGTVVPTGEVTVARILIANFGFWGWWKLLRVRKECDQS